MLRIPFTRSLAALFLTGAFATATFAQFPGGGGDQGIRPEQRRRVQGGRKGGGGGEEIN